VVTDTLRLLQRLIGEQIDLRLSLHSGSLNVKADRTQLEQILMNLVVNARDAMPNGGALTVETTAVVLDESYGRQHGVVSIEPGPHVLLEVSDSGIGMDAETKRRLFEPFFTTKLIGHGTGLGLATVYGIIKQSDGFVWVYSELGKGTTFKVYLPRINTPLAEQCERRLVAAPSRGGSETLLLVEDEEAVRRLARTLFERNGYRVLEAPNPTVAETLCTDEPARIDLMVTDVVMPGMSGPELFRRLQALRPSMKVLYMSGYAAEAIVHRGVLDPGVAFIQKPFTLAGLMEKLREVLNAARPTLLESHRSLAPSRSRHTRH
jgi:CheY-like chemotaxis protein